jgi:plasmid stabilization system protein ParE
VAYRIVYARRADADLSRLEQFIASESPRRAKQAIARILRACRIFRLFLNSANLCQAAIAN